MQLSLRGYQQEALDSVLSYYRKGGNGNALVALPTGSGKSILIAALIDKILQSTPFVKFLCLTHVAELLEQNEQELNRYAPHITTGVYSAGLRRREVGRQVTFAGIQSIYDKPELVADARVVLVDEAHLVPKSGNGMYRKLLGKLLEHNPNVKVMGFTATPYRLDSGLLTHGKDKIFHTITYDANIADLVEQGYLAPLTSATTSAQIDTSGVETKLGEFVQDQLAAAADREEITDAMIDDLNTKCKDRKSILIFCTGVEHARHVSNALKMNGYSSEVIVGDTPSPERAATLERFKRGELRTLVNCSVLTTGLNVPRIDCIVVLRPTKSTSLWVQILGRGSRVFDAKPNCAILDYGQNIDRHGPIDKIKPKVKEKTTRAGEAPVKTCEQCYAECALNARACQECGFAFPEPRPNLTLSASTSPVMSNQCGPAETFQVFDVRYCAWAKEGKLPTLRVDYDCGLTQISEWVGIGHVGFFGENAYRWWKKRDLNGGSVPMNIDDAISETENLKRPYAIKAHREGRFWKVDAYAFDAPAPDPDAPF